MHETIRRTGCLAAATALALAISASAAARGRANSLAATSYEVTPEPATHLFHVAVERSVGAGMQTWRLAVYREGEPGRRGYGRLVRHVTASLNGVPEPIRRIDPDAWQIVAPRAGRLRIQYDVESDSSDDLQLDAHWVDSNGGYFDSASLLLYPGGKMGSPVALAVRLPGGWKAGTALTSRGGQYWAASYSALIDAPFIVGALSERSLSIDGVGHRLVFDNRIPAFDRQAFDRNVRAITSYEMAFFGHVPFRSYTALFRWRPDQQYGGGMEHRGAMLMNVGADWMEDLPGDIAGTFAHEYFHAWNAEAIRPRVHWLPGAAAPSTDLLWFQEGVTSYFALLALVRSGVRDQTQFLTSLGSAITQLESDDSRGYTSLAESSLTAGDRTREQLDFYSGGEVVGFLLDMTIRSRAPHHSLDDVMRRLYAVSLRPGYGGIEESNLVQATRAVTGLDIGPTLRRLVDDRRPIDYPTMLRGTGLEIARSRGSDGATAFKLSVRPDATPAQLRFIERWIRGRG